MPQKKTHVAFDKDDNRLNDILDMIGRVAALDFSITLTPSTDNDMIDAIAVGLNMLSEELNTKVVEKSKMDEVNSKLEKFAYTTAHDLKSPLNSITGLVTLIELSLPPGSEASVSEYVIRLKATVEKMKGLVQGILDYSKVDSESIVTESIPLAEAFHEIIEIDRLAEKADFTISPSLPVVTFNRSAMCHVIRNLLSNAIKYADKSCEINIQCRELDDHYEISVADNGPGIASENHSRIFELFNKVGSGRLDSHGIGLALVRRVLESAGERIWVESSPGKGATFYFTLRKIQPL